MEEDGVGFRGRDSLSSEPRHQDSDRDDDQDIQCLTLTGQETAKDE